MLRTLATVSTRWMEDAVSQANVELVRGATQHGVVGSYEAAAD